MPEYEMREDEELLKLSFDERLEDLPSSNAEDAYRLYFHLLEGKYVSDQTPLSLRLAQLGTVATRMKANFRTDNPTFRSEGFNFLATLAASASNARVQEAYLKVSSAATRTRST